MLRRLFICLLLGFSLSVGAGLAQEKGSAYVLSAGDRIALRVVQWREEEREFQPSVAVNGTYAVQPDGTVSVALAGTFEAAGQTAVGLADAIAVALERRLGSVERPLAVVEVVEFSPFYIIGDVERPGAYPATPGLTALKAFALAGGEPKLLGGASGDVTAGLRDASNLEQAQSELLRARITSVRLAAEREGRDSWDWPENLRHPEGPQALGKLFEEELRIFEARKTALARERASLDELIVLLQTEVTGLETKLTGLRAQLDHAERTLESTSRLLERGLARSTQFSEAQRVLFDLEAKGLDLQNGIYRAQQRIKEAERDLIALGSNRATGAAVELQAVNAKIDTLQTRIDMLRSVILERGVEAEISEAGDIVETRFVVQRDDGAGRVQLSGPDTLLAAGDVVTVSQVLVSQSSDARQ